MLLFNIKHWVNYKGIEYQLVDDFIYDEHNKPITPDDTFAWVDIYGQEHYMEPRDGLPPLSSFENNVTNYYW